MRATLTRLARLRSPRLIGGKYWSLLMKAAYYDREDEMRDLFAKGADIHARDWVRRRRFVFEPREMKQTRAAVVCVFGGAQDGLTALHWAAGEGHARIVRLLLRYGADVNATDHVKNSRECRAARVR